METSKLCLILINLHNFNIILRKKSFQSCGIENILSHFPPNVYFLNILRFLSGKPFKYYNLLLKKSMNIILFNDNEQCKFTLL